MPDSITIRTQDKGDKTFNIQPDKMQYAYNCGIFVIYTHSKRGCESFSFDDTTLIEPASTNVVKSLLKKYGIREVRKSLTYVDINQCRKSN